MNIFLCRYLLNLFKVMAGAILLFVVVVPVRAQTPLKPVRIQVVLDDLLPANSSGPLSINISAEDKLISEGQVYRIRIEISRLNHREVMGLILLDQATSLRDALGRLLGIEDGDLAIKIASLSWSNDASFVISQSEGNRSILTLNLLLPYSEYRFQANAATLDTTVELLDSTIKLRAASDCVLTLREPSFYENLKARYGNRESLLVSIILALVAILTAILKERVKKLFERVLDALGKYGSGKLAERRFLKRYIDNIVFNHKYLKLIGLNNVGISRPQLEEVFISLRVSNQAVQTGLPIDAARSEEGSDLATVSFATALKRNRKMVILGGPGAGKTTTLSYALLIYAQKKAKQVLGVEEDLLPVFIPLRRLTQTTGSILDDLLNKDSQILSADILKECPPNYFLRKLRKGQCLILLDGLDEVTNERTHRQVAEKINHLVADYPDNRFIVTCRIAGWQSLLSGDFTVLQTQDFNRSEIQRFVHGWHRAVITQSERSKLQQNIPDVEKFNERWREHFEQVVKPAIDIQTRRLLFAIERNARILAIAVNPMLLSLICLLHYSRQILPRGRTILYSQCIELLIDAWDRTRDLISLEPKISSSQKEAVIREIAFDFQLKGKGEDTREDIEGLINDIATRMGIRVEAKELLQEIETRSGLLIERAINVFGFSHLTLQEYLVARHIQLNPDRYLALTAHFDKQEWREVILLYAGLLDDATQIVKNIMADDSLERQILAGYGIGDAQHCEKEVSERIIAGLLSALTRGKEPADELINALSMIAADYGETAESIEEKLAEKLIALAREEGLPDLRISAMTILGKAKITHALPTLVNLLYNDNEAIREAAVKVITSFGNLALPALEPLFFVDPRLVSEKPTRPLGWIIPKKDESKAEVPWFKVLVTNMDTVGSIINILCGINTGSSAKLLLNLFAIGDLDVQRAVSLGLSQMLADPFVESDMIEWQENELPSGLQLPPADGNGWTYDNVRPKAPFLRLDRSLRDHVTEIIGKVENGGGDRLREMDAKLGRSSFKILFPALLDYIRTKSQIALRPELIRALGFSDADKNKIDYLTEKIREDKSLSLDYVLRNLEATKSQGVVEFERQPKKGFLAWASSAYLAFFSFFTLVIYIMGFINFLTSYSTWSGYDVFVFAMVTTTLAFYICLISFIKYKLKKNRGEILQLIFSPLNNSLKLLPYLTKYNLWVKLSAYFILIYFFSLTSLATFQLFHYRGEGFEASSKQSLGFFFILYLLFCLASVVYVKKYVLRENPIYHLMMLHSNGRP